MTNITKRVNTESVFVYLTKPEVGKPVPVPVESTSTVTGTKSSQFKLSSNMRLKLGRWP